MKDPLQKEQTPYEILRVGRDADQTQVDRAWMEALAKKRAAPNVLKEARDALVLHPVRRAYYDLLEYDDDALDWLTPSPRKDAAALSPKERGATATAWESQLVKGFPSLETVHSLALLWYWWAVDGEEQDDGGAAGAAKLLSRWDRVIACWAMLNGSPEFWKGRFGLKAAESAELRDQAMAMLRDKFQTLAKRWDDRAGAEIADKYRNLELVLAVEIESAETMRGVGMRTKAGVVACGPLMLEVVGLTQKARDGVAAALAKRPDSKSLQRLKDLLSPYRQIAVLINRNKPAQALDAISGLPRPERQKPEVRQLRAKALHLSAEQKASLKDYSGAMEDWKSASDCQGGDEVDAAIRDAVVEAGKSVDRELGDSQRDLKIEILEKAITIAPDKGLSLTLGEIYADRAVEKINNAQKSLGRKPAPDRKKVIAAVEEGLADLRRGHELGSPRAGKQIGTCEDILIQLKGGIRGAPPEVQDLMVRAQEAMEKNLFDEAVDCLRKVVRIMGRKSPAEVKEALAVALNARGVRKANDAGSRLSGMQGDLFDKALKGHFF